MHANISFLSPINQCSVRDDDVFFPIDHGVFQKSTISLLMNEIRMSNVQIKNDDHETVSYFLSYFRYIF